ncbi:MAG: hypothetical protein KGI38_05775 [Thaumarchaeota archaeon]|nr:hypothetical protein [Nitrososphaerota archaeon]
MLDAIIIIAGVAGVFIALGIAGAALLGFGHATSAVGQIAQSGPVVLAGDTLSGYGIDIITVLIILAIVIVAVFLIVILRR